MGKMALVGKSEFCSNLFQGIIFGFKSVLDEFDPVAVDIGSQTSAEVLLKVDSKIGWSNIKFLSQQADLKFFGRKNIAMNISRNRSVNI
ncbi:hypothetical protein D3C81_1269290 [compost metagenome]